MKVFYFLFASLFLLSKSRNIIRDLPYNIYQIEDMNQYETKYLPEGNKFYIRFSSNLDKDITFHLTIPKNTTLFPLYSSDFSKYPSEDELIKAEYQNEIQLKNREDEEYSTYSFDIKQTDSHKGIIFPKQRSIKLFIILCFFSWFYNPNFTKNSKLQQCNHFLQA